MRGLRIAVLACVAGWALGADAATLHRNEFYFSVPNLDQGFHFTVLQHDVTPGQPYDGIEVKLDTVKDYGFIIVKAGRKGSYDVGYWFRKQVEPGAALGAASDSKFPQDLNFAIRGDLDIEAGGTRVVCRNVVIGQGHQTFTNFNNWWVGGPGMTLETGDKGRKLLKQTCDGGTIRTAVGGVGVNNFDLYVSGP